MLSRQLDFLCSHCVSLSAQAPSNKPGPSSVSKPINVSAAPETVLPVEEDFEFSDVGALTCLLCARQFKTADQLKRHNKESDLHKARIPQLYVLPVSKIRLTWTFVLFLPLHFIFDMTEKLQGPKFA
jgi:hypothetical protein